jgi:hypothetical protein
MHSSEVKLNEESISAGFHTRSTPKLINTNQREIE